MINSKEVFHMLPLSTGVNEGFGDQVPLLILCSFMACVFIYISYFQGVATYRQVIFVFAAAPYLLIVFLLGRSLSLKNAWSGIYQLKPSWTRLGEAQVEIRLYAS
jgi:hypothetical protein